MKKETQKEFINGIAIEGNLDPETVRRVFVAMVRYVLKTLKYKGICPLPDFGTFKITKYKETVSLNVNTMEKEFRPARKVISFIPDYKLSQYIKEKLY